jgi:hypothetical protein
MIIRAEKQQMPMLLSLVSPDRDSNTRYTELEAILLTITPPMQLQGNESPVVIMDWQPMLKLIMFTVAFIS